MKDRWIVDVFFFFFQAEDGIRDLTVTGVQTCALPICCDGGGADCFGPGPPDAEGAGAGAGAGGGGGGIGTLPVGRPVKAAKDGVTESLTGTAAGPGTLKTCPSSPRLLPPDTSATPPTPSRALSCWG